MQCFYTKDERIMKFCMKKGRECSLTYEARRQVVKAWLAVYYMWRMNNYASSQLKLPHKTEPENHFYSLISLWFRFIHALCGEHIFSYPLVQNIHAVYHKYFVLVSFFITITWNYLLLWWQLYTAVYFWGNLLTCNSLFYLPSLK